MENENETKIITDENGQKFVKVSGILVEVHQDRKLSFSNKTEQVVATPQGPFVIDTFKLSKSEAERIEEIEKRYGYVRFVPPENSILAEEKQSDSEDEKKLTDPSSLARKASIREDICDLPKHKQIARLSAEYDQIRVDMERAIAEFHKKMKEVSEVFCEDFDDLELSGQEIVRMTSTQFFNLVANPYKKAREVYARKTSDEFEKAGKGKIVGSPRYHNGTDQLRSVINPEEFKKEEARRERGVERLNLSKMSSKKVRKAGATSKRKPNMKKMVSIKTDIIRALEFLALTCEEPEVLAGWKSKVSAKLKVAVTVEDHQKILDMIQQIL